MCWSKRKRTADDSGPKTTLKQMGEIKCPESADPCDSQKKDGGGYCHNGGLCCYPKTKDKDVDRYCVCQIGYIGDFCQKRGIEESRKDMERTTTIAAFSAILGVIVITLFVALVVLQIKYCSRRKKRRQMLADDDHELNMISRVDASDRGSKKRLILQPGYSWRESVRRTHSKALHKFRSTMSRSVPDDLFQVGLKLAIFGGFQSKPSPNDHQSAAGKADVRAVIADRCLSSGPDVGDGQTVCDEADNSNASIQPIVVQMPTTAADADARAEEDTVK